jgi:hypothetical protein
MKFVTGKARTQIQGQQTPGSVFSLILDPGYKPEPAA